MGWQEEVLAIEEIKQIYEARNGWVNRGGDRRSEAFRQDQILSDGICFSQTKLGEELSLSQQKVSQDLQLADAVKRYPAVAEGAY